MNYWDALALEATQMQTQVTILCQCGKIFIIFIYKKIKKGDIKAILNCFWIKQKMET